MQIIVRKKTIEIINGIDSDKTHVIKLSTLNGIDDQIRAIADTKETQAKSVLNAFIRAFGGSSALILQNIKLEGKILDEEFIDMIPLKMTFHSSVGKKVYKENNFEFANEGLVANYLKNRSLESFAPEIADAINNMANVLREPLHAIQSNINVFEDIFKYGNAIYELDDEQRLLLSEWISKKFGACVK